MMRTRRIAKAFSHGAFGVGLVAFGIMGCHNAQPGPEPRAGYFVRGNVLGVDARAGTVALAHEAIPGFMPAMTMDYKLANPSEITELHAGDRITATLLSDKGQDGPSNLRLTDLNIIAEARPDAAPLVHYHVPVVGDVVPNYLLLNQSGKTIDLQQFRGKVVAMTLVYTRCPLPDYCVRMSRNFAEMDKALSADPKLYAKTHLLTVSFDPTYDTPKVLRSYGGAYTGRFSQETFAHWDFAAPRVSELPVMEHWFDVGVTSGPNGSLSHTLATTIIGPDGKVLAFYPTNEWSVEDALRVMRGAVS